MSVSLVLIPLAIAAVSAVQAARAENPPSGETICHVQTRMKDPTLLAAALHDTHAAVRSTPAELHAQWSDMEAVFRRDAQGIWQAHFTGITDVQRATEIVGHIDVAYGRQVQQAVIAKLRSRAGNAGMSIESETIEPDASVTLVLNVGQP